MAANSALIAVLVTGAAKEELNPVSPRGEQRARHSAEKPGEIIATMREARRLSQPAAIKTFPKH